MVRKVRVGLAHLKAYTLDLAKSESWSADLVEALGDTVGYANATSGPNPSRAKSRAMTRLSRDYCAMSCRLLNHQPAPGIDQGLDEPVDIGIGMERRRREAQALGAARHGRII
jgi:hypothetical protein